MYTLFTSRTDLFMYLAAAATSTDVEDVISICLTSNCSSPPPPPPYSVVVVDDGDDDEGVVSQPTQGLIFLRCKLIKTETSQFTIIWLIIIIIIIIIIKYW